MKQHKKRFFLVLLGLAVWVGYAATSAQSIQQLEAMYEVAVPVLGGSVPTEASQEVALHVQVTLSGRESVKGVEVRVGSAPDKAETSVMYFELMYQEGIYFLEGAGGRFYLQDNKTRLVFPIRPNLTSAYYVSAALHLLSGGVQPSSWVVLE
jgi:hypothetical protein